MFILLHWMGLPSGENTNIIQPEKGARRQHQGFVELLQVLRGSTYPYNYHRATQEECRAGDGFVCWEELIWVWAEFIEICLES